MRLTLWEELHDTLAEDGNLWMIFRCYMDDSKDANEEKLAICGGLVGERNNWKGFSELWNQCLTDNGIQYFKSSECRMLRGQFAKFRGTDYPPPTGRNAANQIRDALKGIIDNFPGIGWYAVGIPLEDWRRICEDGSEEQLLLPYHRAIETVMATVVSEGFRKSPHRDTQNSRILFIHDQEENCPIYERLYRLFRTKNPRTAKFAVGLSCLDDKVHPPLQAADLIANSSLRVGLKWLNEGKPKLTEVEMGKSFAFFKMWDENIMRELMDRRKKEKAAN